MPLLIFEYMWVNDNWAISCDKLALISTSKCKEQNIVKHCLRLVKQQAAWAKEDGEEFPYSVTEIILIKHERKD